MFCALALQLLCTPLTPWLDAVSLESSFLKLTQKRQAHTVTKIRPIQRTSRRCVRCFWQGGMTTPAVALTPHPERAAQKTAHDPSTASAARLFVMVLGTCRRSGERIIASGRHALTPVGIFLENVKLG